jgi:subtilisin family serine protease
MKTALAIVFVAALMATQAPSIPQGPDLIVKEITVEPSSPKPGEVVTITAVILNQGREDVEDSFNVRLEMSLGPPELSVVGLGEMGGISVGVQRVLRLKSGRQAEVHFRWEVIKLPLIKIRVVADAPFDKIEESNEKNNRLEHVIYISSKYIRQWWLERIKAPKAWEITRGSDEVIVAVIDSGIDYNHPELAEAMWVNPDEIPNGIDDDGNGFVDDIYGWDFVDDDNDSLNSPIDMHGTAVAGLIAAADDGIGITGVAPGVKIMDVRILDPSGRGSFDDLIKAIDYAVAMGADIINMSFGAPYDIPEDAKRWLKENLKPHLEAVADQVILVSAVGNEAAEVGWPARFDSVVAVAATIIDNTPAGYSNFGPKVDVAAPGGALSWSELLAKLAKARGIQDLLPILNDLLITPYLRDYYGWFGGTSASTPLVSGVIALMLSISPDLTTRQVKEILKKTATDLGRFRRGDEVFKWTLVNAARALEYIK